MNARTFVVILSGRNRSRIGHIAGDLADRQQRAKAVNFDARAIFHAPNFLSSVRLTNLREATPLEIVMLQRGQVFK